MPKIEPEVAEVLASLKIEDTTAHTNRFVTARITELLTKQLYLKVNKVLENLGGKWDRKTKGHRFTEDPREKIKRCIETLSYEKSSRNGFFPTPKAVAEILVRAANIEKHHRVLEPSAGRGDLADVIANYTEKSKITCVEFRPDNYKILREKGYMAIQADFLTDFPADFPQVTALPLFDRIIMNPPFEKQGDIIHVDHAVNFLRPGGRLVSVMLTGITSRTDKKTQTLRMKLSKPPFTTTYTELPPDSFKESKAMVNTIYIVVDKEGENNGQLH